jgi:hypothetical protein
MNSINYGKIVLVLLVCSMMSSIVFAGYFTSPDGGTSSSGTGAVTSTGNTILLHNGRSIPTSQINSFLDVKRKCTSGNKDCWRDNGNGRIIYHGPQGGEVPYSRFDGFAEGAHPASGYSIALDGSLYSLDGTVKIGADKKLYRMDDDGAFTESIGEGYSRNTVQSITTIGTGVNSMVVVEGADTYYITKDSDNKVELSREEYRDYKGLIDRGLVGVSGGGGSNREMTFGAPDSNTETITITSRSNGVRTATSVTKDTDDTVLSTTTNTRHPGDIRIVESGDNKVLSYGIGDDRRTISIESYAVNGQIDFGNGVTGKVEPEGEGSRLTITGKDKLIDRIYSNNLVSSIEQTTDFDDKGKASRAYGRYGASTFETVYDHDTTSGTNMYSYKTTFLDGNGAPRVVVSSEPIDRKAYSNEIIPIGNHYALVYDDEKNKLRDDDGNIRVVVVSADDIKNGDYSGNTVSFSDAELEEIESGEVLTKCLASDACPQILATIKEGQKYNRGERGYTATRSLFSALGQIGRTQGLSSLLYPVVPFDDWASSIDKWFSRSVFNEEAIASGICYALVLKPIDSQDDGVAFIENSYGNVQPIANIFGEVSKTSSLLCEIDEDGEGSCPDELECLEDGFCHEANGDHVDGFFYKISWAVGAPADEAATPIINEDGTVLNYNVWLERDGDSNVGFYESAASDDCPLKLVNGGQDGAVVTWWSNKDYTGEDVCIRWEQCGTKIITTGGSAVVIDKGDTAEGRPIKGPCNAIVEATKNVAQIGTHNPVMANNEGDTQSVRTDDEDAQISLNIDELR